MDLNNCELKYLKNSYVVADVHCVGRPILVLSVLKMYRLFLVIVPLNNTVLQHLHSIYIVLGIISNLEMV